MNNIGTSRCRPSLADSQQFPIWILIEYLWSSGLIHCLLFQTDVLVQLSTAVHHHGITLISVQLMQSTGDNSIYFPTL